MTFVQAIVLAILQGISELFPVSSLGHTILIPALLGWHNIDRADPSFLAFVVVLHLGTAIALIVFYRNDWAKLARAFVGSIVRGKLSDDPDERIAWLLVVGTIPVGILGLLFKEKVSILFGTVAPAAIFLMINGLVMFAGDWLRRRQHEQAGVAYKAIEQLSYPQSVLVGFGQAFALLPGISRSGASIVVGLLCDLDTANAARYSFLLATPVIFAAGALAIPELWAPGAHGLAMQAIVGAVLAGIFAYLSVAFLTKYFKNHDLRAFGWYCLLFGALCLILAKIGVIS
ncbi:MAG: undecaprenyl-diphosphatase [Candidatus Eremiobacteraeota bacterium]|nr:undecaprenyl-diphosphatase [Candidatus Eremiobacteraeota bacterium]